MNESNWLLLQSGPGEPALNMALDEALLLAMPRLNQPILRFYSWTERAASFGYFQQYAEVERLVQLRPLIRRPTGGGIVPHDGDWTYTLAFPVTNEWYELTAMDSYRRVHEWLRAAFDKLGFATELASAAREGYGGQCFVGHAQFDLLWRGQKIAGAAQRRTRDGLLIQGSVQPPVPAPARADWQAAVCSATPGRSAVSWEPFEPDAPLLERASALAREKYSQIDYNHKR